MRWELVSAIHKTQFDYTLYVDAPALIRAIITSSSNNNNNKNNNFSSSLHSPPATATIATTASIANESPLAYCAC